MPLYYENRIPELQLTNAQFNRDMERLLEEAELDEAQEAKLEREFAREYHLITRDDRLEKIAEDIVLHFHGARLPGQGDGRLASTRPPPSACTTRCRNTGRCNWPICWQSWRRATRLERPEIEDKVSYMQETDMAVVVSQSQNEVEDLQKKGADITPHRKRMLARRPGRKVQRRRRSFPHRLCVRHVDDGL